MRESIVLLYNKVRFWLCRKTFDKQTEQKKHMINPKGSWTIISIRRPTHKIHRTKQYTNNINKEQKKQTSRVSNQSKTTDEARQDNNKIVYTIQTKYHLYPLCECFFLLACPFFMSRPVLKIYKSPTNVIPFFFACSTHKICLAVSDICIF